MYTFLHVLAQAKLRFDIASCHATSITSRNSIRFTKTFFSIIQTLIMITYDFKYTHEVQLSLIYPLIFLNYLNQNNHLCLYHRRSNVVTNMLTYINVSLVATKIF